MSEDEQPRQQEAHGVREDRQRRRHQADQPAAEGRTGALRDRPRRLELAVAVDELVALDERRQVRLVRHVEEDRQRPDHEADHVHLPHRQDAERVRDRDRREHGRPTEVAGDEDGPATEPIDPGAGGQAEQDERQELDRAEQGHFEGRRLQAESLPPAGPRAG